MKPAQTPFNTIGLRDDRQNAAPMAKAAVKILPIQKSPPNRKVKANSANRIGIPQRKNV